MTTGPYYLFTGNPRDPIPDGFELADVQASTGELEHEAKALHVWTGEGEPDLFDWELWEGDVEAVPPPPVEAPSGHVD